MPIEPLLLSVTPIETFAAGNMLTNATGFFFQRDDNLYLVSSRHVFFDDASGHAPDQIQITLHIDPENITRCVDYLIPLYRNNTSQWIQGLDASGEVDLAIIKIDKQALPKEAIYTAFTPENILGSQENIDIGSNLLIVGFPLGFQDTLHQLPVVRHAINASSFSMRFQGFGYFLTDARTHRGSSGAPVVYLDRTMGSTSLPYKLLGVHSARFDVASRDVEVDEALGLNCTWFADILLKLTEQTSVRV